MFDIMLVWDNNLTPFFSYKLYQSISKKFANPSIFLKHTICSMPYYLPILETIPERGNSGKIICLLGIFIWRKRYEKRLDAAMLYVDT